MTTFPDGNYSSSEVVWISLYVYQHPKEASHGKTEFVLTSYIEYKEEFMIMKWDAYS